MTRQRIRPSLKRSVFQECPHCRGRSRATRVAEMFRTLFAAANPVGAAWDYALYTWWWTDEELDAVAQVTGVPTPLSHSRSTRRLPLAEDRFLQHW